MKKRYSPERIVGKLREADVQLGKGLKVSAINNHGGFGRWAFVEVRDPWDVETQLRESVRRRDA